MTPPPPLPRARGPALLGLLAVVLAFGGLGAWSALAPLASAALAPGTVAVEGNRRVVQHPDGGVVRSIEVRDGDRVAEGQVLLILDDTRILGLLETLRPLLAANMAQRARLEAERLARSDVVFPSAEIAEVALSDHAAAVAHQRRLFESRAGALRARLASLAATTEQAEATAQTHRAQLRSLEQRERLAQREHQLFARLQHTAHAPETRVLQTEGSIEGVRGEIARVQGLLAAEFGRAVAAARDADRARADFLAAVDEDIQRVDAEHVDLRQRLIAASHQSSRTVVRAPAAGLVVNRAVHTVGGVVASGAPLLEIVPDDRLVVVAEVRPNDVERVHPGMRAEIRLSGLDGGLTPRVVGVVERVSADRIVDRSRQNLGYFEVRIEAPDLAAVRPLRPGMPVDVMIIRGERTVFAYLGGVLLDIVTRGLRE